MWQAPQQQCWWGTCRITQQSYNSELISQRTEVARLTVSNDHITVKFWVMPLTCLSNFKSIIQFLTWISQLWDWTRSCNENVLTDLETGLWYKDQSVYAPNQWKTMLHWNVDSHWPGAYRKVSLLVLFLSSCLAGWNNIKMPSYQYRKSHCGGKTVSRPSYLHNGISYTGKTASVFWIRFLSTMLSMIQSTIFAGSDH